jgi:hypothetical protein
MGLAEDLKTLQELHDKGRLTEQEFADAKKATLNQQATPTARRTSAPLLTWRVKIALALLVVLVGSVWYNAGTKNTTNMLATAVHAPITLKDEVENLPASSVKSLGINVPYGGTVDITLNVVSGNPLDVFLIDADQLQAVQRGDWNNVKSYNDFNGLKTKTYRRTARLNEGGYYVVMRDTSLGILSSSASDVSVKVQLNP